MAAAAYGPPWGLQALALVLLVARISCQKSQTLTAQQLRDWAALANGVGKFPGSDQTASRLLAFGNGTLIVALDGTSVSVAAARFGAGRLVHFGHEGFLGYPAATSGTGRLLINALKWTSGKSTSIRVAGTSQWGADIAAALAKVGRPYKMEGGRDSHYSHVYCCWVEFLFLAIPSYLRHPRI
jgi:hypothetical protein